MQAQPEVFRARLDSAERKRAFVDELIRDELLAQEARARGIANRPEVQAAINRLLIQQLLSQVAEGHTPTESEAREWYEAHRAEYQRPERRQVQVLTFEGASAAVEAKKVLARLNVEKGEERRRAFEGLKPAPVDLGPRTSDELAQQFSAVVATAAFALPTRGALSEPLSTPKGVAVLMLDAIQPAEERPFDSEKSRILARLTAEARQVQLQALVAELKKRQRVERDLSVIDGLDPHLPQGSLVR